MLEVTCFHCGQVVQISPDVERCSVCGMNLRKLIGREQASSYFYARAAELAGTGNVLGALQEVQRGLAYTNASELNLLGAILCKRLGRWDDMRHYVAAIPADDPLRGEGEWLLRSNQARQRPAPAAGSTGRNKAPVALPIIPDSDALPVVLDEVAPSPHHPKPTRSGAGRGLTMLVALTLIAVLAGAGWIGWQSGLLPLGGDAVAEQAAPPAGDQPAAAQATVVPAILIDPAPADAQAFPAGAEAAPAAIPGATPDSNGDAADAPTDPTSLFPTPTVAPDLVESAPISQAIASTSDAAAVSAAGAGSVDLSRLDWQAWLRERNRTDLADLPVTVRVQDKILILEGTVEYAEQRAALEFEAKQLPGIADVSLVNVTLRPPQRYTVQEGDSLWVISVRIYGNADQIEEIYAANRDQMTSAGDLRVGMVLAVPPIE